MDRVDFVAEQLRAISPGVDWNVSGIDRSRELAEILVRDNITDLWALRLIPVEWVEHIPARWVETESSGGWENPQDVKAKGYAFDYYGRQVGFLGTPTRRDNEPVLQERERGFMIAWSAEGHGNVAYVVEPNKQTKQLSFVPRWGSSSDAADIRMAVVAIVSFFAFTALPLAGVSVGNAIGTAVLPASLAASYPALATAVGNVALSAALSGGDVKSAVQNAVIGAVSGGVGTAAQIASESALIGTVAAAAANAAIKGGSIAEAVGFAALSHGAKNVGDLFELSSDPAFAFDFSEVDGGFVYTPEFAFDFGGQIIDVGSVPLVADVPAFDPLPLATQPPPDRPLPFDPVTFDFSSVTGAAAIDSLPVDNRGVPVVPAVTPPPQSPNWNPVNLVQGISSAALAAISLIKAYRSLDTPQIQTSARVVRPNGSISVVGANGLIQTRDAAGNVTAGKPPVGVPQASVNGNYIVNNGDGTYTTIAPDGSRQVLSYGGAASGGDGLFGLSPSMTIGLIGIGVALLTRKK